MTLNYANNKTPDDRSNRKGKKFLPRNKKKSSEGCKYPENISIKKSLHWKHNMQIGIRFLFCFSFTRRKN